VVELKVPSRAWLAGFSVSLPYQTWGFTAVNGMCKTSLIATRKSKKTSYPCAVELFHNLR
jgi:hypothetical protein